MTQDRTGSGSADRGWTEEQVAALVDGSIEDPEKASILRQIVERDPDARAYAEQIRQSNELLSQAFDIPAQEPIPDEIRAAIYGPSKGSSSNVTTLRSRFDRQSATRPGFRTWVPTALAASIALVVGVSMSSYFSAPSSPAIAVLGEAPDGGALHTALETLPSGAVSTSGVQPMLTFFDSDGRPCREFDVQGVLPDALEFGIACRNPAGRWHVEIMVAAPVTSPGPQGYAPASGPGGDALDAMLDALGAGPAIAPDDEAALLEGGWRQ